MNDKQNRQNVYQGQLKASSTDEGKFLPKNPTTHQPIDYFEKIKAICNNNISYIKRLGIYWDRPGNRRVLQNGQEDKTPYILINDGGDNRKFEIGYNYILQFRDVQITSIKVTQESSPNCYFDFIGV